MNHVSRKRCARLASVRMGLRSARLQPACCCHVSFYTHVAAGAELLALARKHSIQGITASAQEAAVVATEAEQHRQLLLSFQDLGALFAQLRAVTAQGNVAALLGVTHKQRSPGYPSLACDALLGLARICIHACDWNRPIMLRQTDKGTDR